MGALGWVAGVLVEAWASGVGVSRGGGRRGSRFEMGPDRFVSQYPHAGPPHVMGEALLRRDGEGEDRASGFSN